MKRVVALLVVGLVLSACSVTTPRREEGVLRADGRTAADGMVVTEDGVVVESSSAEGGGGSGPSGGGAAGRAAASGSAAGSTGKTAAGGAGGAAASNNTASATGVTKDTVTVSVVAGFSGPLAGVVARAYDGLLTWQDDVNEAGGIHGRKVLLKKVDHKESADGGVAACKEALSNGSFFAIVPEGVEATLTAVSCLDAAGMPTFYYSATTDPKWKVAFADIVTSAQAGTQMAQFVRGRWAGQKAGVIYVNQASYKAMADAFDAEAKRARMAVASMEAVEPNQASFTSPLLRLKDAGVQVLVISATTDAVGILRDAKSLGWAPTVSGWGFQFDFVTAAGRSLFDGVTGLRSYATVDTPAYEKYAARMQARGRGRARTDDLEGFPTYGHALVIGELLKRAGANPTRASLVAGAESVSNYDNGILGPFSWSPSDHVGAHGTFPTICCNSDYTWKALS